MAPVFVDVRMQMSLMKASYLRRSRLRRMLFCRKGEPAGFCALRAASRSRSTGFCVPLSARNPIVCLPGHFESIGRARKGWLACRLRLHFRLAAGTDRTAGIMETAENPAGAKRRLICYEEGENCPVFRKKRHFRPCLSACLREKRTRSGLRVREAVCGLLPAVRRKSLSSSERCRKEAPFLLREEAARKNALPSLLKVSGRRMGVRGQEESPISKGFPPSPAGSIIIPCYLPPSSPTLRAARKASWGSSTLPMRFMRFLPSFCFSSSLRLRVISPP